MLHFGKLFQEAKMRRFSVVLTVTLALMAGAVLFQGAPWALNSALAATSLDGRIVQDPSGALWLVRQQTRHPVTPAVIADSELSNLGIGAAFDRLVQGVVTTPADGRQTVGGVAGQKAKSDFSGSPIQVTVREMTIASALPEAPGEYSFSAATPAATPQGKFVVLLVDVENVGTQPVCCLPGFRLKDSKGRFFSGQTNNADALVKHAKRTIYLVDDPRGELQPNMARPQVLVYDVPTDADRLSIAPR